MFFLIGLGLGDPSDITLRGKQIIEHCDRVYLEAYTSILLHGAKESLVSGNCLFDSQQSCWEIILLFVFVFADSEEKLSVSVSEFSRVCKRRKFQ